MQIKKHQYVEFILNREMFELLKTKHALVNLNINESSRENSLDYTNCKIEEIEKAINILHAQKEKRPFTIITKGTFEDLTDRIIETIIIPDPRSRGEIVSNERRKLEFVLLDFLGKVRVEVEGG